MIRPNAAASPEDEANRGAHIRALSTILAAAISAQDTFDREHGLPRQGRLMAVLISGEPTFVIRPHEPARPNDRAAQAAHLAQVNAIIERTDLEALIPAQDAYDRAAGLPRQGRNMVLFVRGQIEYITRPGEASHPDDLAARNRHEAILSATLTAAIDMQDDFDRRHHLPRQGRKMVVIVEGTIKQLIRPGEPIRADDSQRHDVHLHAIQAILDAGAVVPPPLYAEPGPAPTVHSASAGIPKARRAMHVGFWRPVPSNKAHLGHIRLGERRAPTLGRPS